MVKTLTTDVINGAVRLIEDIRYSNGKHVKRVLDPVTGFPIDIVDVTPSGLFKTQSGIALKIGALLK